MDRFPPQALRTSPFVYYAPKQNISLKKHELKKRVTAGFQLVLKWVSRIEIPNHSPLNMNEELLPYDLVHTLDTVPRSDLHTSPEHRCHPNWQQEFNDKIQIQFASVACYGNLHCDLA